MRNFYSIYILLSFLFISHAFAESKAIQLEGKKLGKFPIRVLGSGKYQNATFGSSDKSTVTPRHLNGIGAEALAGLVVGPVIIGGGAEYMNWLQATHTKDDHDDGSGKTTNLFGSVGMALGRFLFVGKYFFQSTYQLSTKDINGEKVQYYSPEGSFTVAAVYRFGKRSFFNIESNSLTYGKKKTGGTTTSLNDNEKIKFTSVGLSYGMMF